MVYLEDFCRFCKTFFQIKWTTTTLIICALPFLLLFLIIQLGFIIFDGDEGAIVTNSKVCGEIGKDIFKEDGSVVDAAIGILFCESVLLPKMVGIGGGFSAIMLVHGRIDTISAITRNPKNISQEFFESPYKLRASQAGGVPGALLGYWEMHEKYGLLSWKRIIEPSIRLCNTLYNLMDKAYSSANSSHIFTKFWIQEKKRFRVLSTTLKKISEKGPDVFYHGEIGKKFIEDIQLLKGLMTQDDLRNYQVTWSREPVTFRLPQGLKGYTTPLPSVGALVALVINIVKPFAKENETVFWHKVVEAMKHSLPMSTKLSDLENENVPELIDIIKETYEDMRSVDFARSIREKIYDDKTFNDTSYYGFKYGARYMGGSLSICIVAPNGDSISLTSSVVWNLGSYFLSRKTGIPLNNHLRRLKKIPIPLLPPFSYFKPGRRPLSPHTPVIVLNAKLKRPFFVVGATGGAYIAPQVITAVIKFCILGLDSFRSLNTGFLRPLVLARKVEYDDENPTEVIEYLKMVGNRVALIQKSLLSCTTTCIANSHGIPRPVVTRRSNSKGKMFLKPKQISNLFYLMCIITISLVVILVLLYDYFGSIKHHVYFEDDDKINC